MGECSSNCFSAGAQAWGVMPTTQKEAPGRFAWKVNVLSAGHMVRCVLSKGVPAVFGPTAKTVGARRNQSRRPSEMDNELKFTLIMVSLLSMSAMVLGSQIVACERHRYDLEAQINRPIPAVGRGGRHLGLGQREAKRDEK